MDERIIKNSICQINDNGINKEWIGCIIQVDEIKSWGIQGFIKIPMQGKAYIRIKWEEIDYVGEATMIFKEND